jgi:peptidyl-prolyl cis-trans isomerase SurA
MRPRRTLTLLAALLLAFGASPAAAQPLQRIAAVVNDEVISVFDVENRMRLIIATSGLTDNGETRGRLQGQIMRSLIDERLQMQEANRLNVAVSESEIEGAIQRIEQANRMPRGGLVAALREAGIDRSAIESQIKSAIGWQKVVTRRLRPTLQVGEDEIDEVLQRITASKGAVEYRLAEIFLSVETPEQEDEVRQNAENLVEQMRRGTAFAAIAQQFSQSASAQSGGDIGWVERSQLEDEIVSIFDQMPVGRSTLPIRTPSGFYLYLLRDRRVLAAPSPDDATVTLAQLVIPIEADATPAEVAAQKELAQTVQESVSGCEDLQRAAKELGAPPVDPTPDLRVGDLNPAIKPVVTNLKVGDAAAPLETGAGFAIVMVCARQEAKSNLPGRDDIAENLTRQRLDLMSRRYLRDLRRAAFIDVRV